MIPNFSRKELGQDICRVLSLFDMIHPQYIGSNSFPHPVVAESIVPFLQDAVRNGGTVNNSHIVPKHHARTLNRYSQHTKHISCFHNLVCANPCSNKLRSICSSFHT